MREKTAELVAETKRLRAQLAEAIDIVKHSACDCDSEAECEMKDTTASACGWGARAFIAKLDAVNKPQTGRAMSKIEELEAENEQYQEDALYMHSIVHELRGLLAEARKVIERFALNEPREILPLYSIKKPVFDIRIEVDNEQDGPKFADWFAAREFLAKLDAVNKP